MANKIQIKRGLKASLPTLDTAEFGFCTDTHELFIGTNAINYEVLMKTFFDTGTFLYATTSGTPQAKTAAEVKEILNLEIGTDVLAQQTIGIADDNLVEMDDADAQSGDYAKFTTNGLEGRSTSEVLSDLGVESGADVTDSTSVDAAGAVMESDFTSTSFLYATSSGTPEPKTPIQVLDVLSGQATSPFDFNSQKIVNLADPTAAQDGVTKAYCDSVAQGLNPHDSVLCATIANISLTGEQTIDGVSTSGSRVLVKNQSNTADNGIYVTASGSWARASDLDESSEVAGSYVFVSSGTTQASTGWVCTNEPESVTIGVDPILFTQYSDVGFVQAGTGLVKVGNTLNVDGILEDLDSLGPNSSDGEILVGTGAGAFAWESGATARASLGLVIGTDVLAQQTIGIADDNLVEMDDADAESGDYAKLTASGIEGRNYAEVLSDLSGQATADFSMNTHKITNVVDPVSDQDAATKKWVSDNFSAGALNFVGLADTPASYSGAGSYLVTVNSGTTALEFVDFASTYLEAAPTNGETGKAPNSDWAYDHDVATTGVHGAGANTILHSGSTIDGGSFI